MRPGVALHLGQREPDLQGAGSLLPAALPCRGTPAGATLTLAVDVSGR